MADIDVRTDPELDAFVEESRQLNKAIELATRQSPSFATAEGLAQLRSGEGMPTAGPVDEAIDIDLPGPAGPLPARALVPPRANLVAGLFDLGLTPSARMSQDAAMIPLATIEACLAHFLPGLDPEQRRSPDVSPLYADLTGMPPALLTVGTLDPLIDDSLFMAARWRVAGGEAEVAIYPESVHRFAALPTAMARAARARMANFIRQRTSG